jgi:hypothetical protein
MQAQGRAQRIGQTREVMVLRLLAAITTKEHSHSGRWGAEDRVCAQQRYRYMPAVRPYARWLLTIIAGTGDALSLAGCAVCSI